MTRAAKAFGKDLSNFMRSPETKAYVDELAQTVNSTDCVQAFRGGRTPGTWAHPKLAVFFSRWMDRLRASRSVRIRQALPKLLGDDDR